MVKSKKIAIMLIAGVMFLVSLALIGGCASGVDGTERRKKPGRTIRLKTISSARRFRVMCLCGKWINLQRPVQRCPEVSSSGRFFKMIIRAENILRKVMIAMFKRQKRVVKITNENKV